MKIRRIRIEGFRKFRGAVEIAGLADGLNVVAGDNEEGKSTVLAAVQSVFFNRHRLGGEAAQAMQPFGSQLRPVIRVDFEFQEQPYALRKAFCQTPEAELVTPRGTIRGDAVEDALQDLLRFEPPGKGAAKSEHRGIWGLFWIEQGKSFEPLSIKGTSRETIVAALEGEVGQVLGGERGRALLAAIQERYSAVFTKAGRERGPLKLALDEAGTAERELGEVRSQLAEYEQKVEQLGRIQARLKRYADERTIETAESRLKDLEAAEAMLSALRATVATAEQDQKLAEAAKAAAAERWRARETLIGKVADANRHRAAREEAAATATAAAELARTQVDAAEADLAAASAAVERAQDTLDTAGRALSRAQLEQQERDLGSRLDKARQARDRADAKRREAATIGLDDAALARLREEQQRADAARFRLEAIATRLEFAPDDHRRILIDGRPVSPAEPHLLTGRATISLEGFGTVTVTPGGDDLARLRTAEADAARTVTRALAQAGVESLDAAAALVKGKSVLLMDAAQDEAVALAHAPEGFDALAQQHARIGAELAALRVDAAGAALSLEEATTRHEAAKAAVDTAKPAVDRARELHKRAATGFGAAREVLARTQAELKGAVDLEAALTGELERDRAAESDEQVHTRLVRAANDLDAARAVAEARRAELERAKPEEIRLALEMARDAATHLRNDREALGRNEIALISELGALGQRGLGEKSQELEGRLERARARAGRLERDARALKLLLETLTAAERQARESFFEPVRQRIRPYLKHVFPDSDLVLSDDDFADLSLRRDGVDEPFESLSVGTREQLAVLTRLAFADFLREKGQPAPLILDDALVYADEDRFRRMQLVLRKAADHLQVIILTCRESDYALLGAPVIRLADCQVGT